MGAEKPGLSSFRKYLSKTKRSAPPQNAPKPSARLSTFRRLSFKMNSSRNWNLRRRKRRPEAFLHFLKSKKPSNQLVFELSLVKTISPIHRPTLSEVERRHTFKQV